MLFSVYIYFQEEAALQGSPYISKAFEFRICIGCCITLKEANTNNQAGYVVHSSRPSDGGIAYKFVHYVVWQNDKMDAFGDNRAYSLYIDKSYRRIELMEKMSFTNLNAKRWSFFSFWKLHFPIF